MSRSRSLLAAAALVLGCPRPETPGKAPVRVFAASSLTEAFEALEADFEAAHPELDVQLSFAGSQVLRLQLEQGAAADVFASANARHMEALQRSGRVSDAQVFASNRLVVIVPAGDMTLQRFEDLPEASRIVVGTEDVPVGRYTRTMLERVGASFATAVLAKVVSQENNVRLVLAKVELGEADAAIVYRTDVSDRVRVIDVPTAYDVPIHYPIAVVRDAVRPEAAAAFVDHLRSPPGQAVLRRHGFDTTADAAEAR